MGENNENSAHPANLETLHMLSIILAIHVMVNDLPAIVRKTLVLSKMNICLKLH